jgi:hypothetical protein
LRSKLSGAKSPQRPVSTISQAPAKKEESKPATTKPDVSEYEMDLIRLMVLFGTSEVKLTVNDEETTCSVIELVYNELKKDELVFENELYKMIFEEFVKGLEDDVLLSSSYFKKLENQKVVSFVSNLESNEVELSYNWIQKFNIYTKLESDNLYKSVMNSIYNFKYHKVDELIAKIKIQIKQSSNNDDELLSLLSEQMSYERIKKILSERLGRIILK